MQSTVILLHHKYIYEIINLIRITEDDSTHELRYSFSDKVEGMENLFQKLSEIMDEIREMD